MPQILILVQSPLLQGGALSAVLEFFRALIALNLPRLGFRDLLQVSDCFFFYFISVAYKRFSVLSSDDDDVDC